MALDLLLTLRESRSRPHATTHRIKITGLVVTPGNRPEFTVCPPPCKVGRLARS
jgi:hypothetical protein